MRAFDFFTGCPVLVIPDNPRTEVNRTCRYEPDLNRTYLKMAQHYGVAILPARPRKPRDKAKVESAVGIVKSHTKRDWGSHIICDWPANNTEPQ
jgi:transposase